MIPIQIVLLLGVLVATLVSFACMGMRQMNRSRRLAREANEAGLRFSREDTFEIHHLYRRFLPIHAGHSPVANNITYGRVGGMPVRAFDFRYEIGHGTHRQTRRYGIIMVETERPIESVTMWNELDTEPPPLYVRDTADSCMTWSVSGRRRAIETLAVRCQHLAADGLSIQTSGSWMMLCLPLRRRRQSYMLYIEQATALAKALSE